MKGARGSRLICLVLILAWQLGQGRQPTGSPTTPWKAAHLAITAPNTLSAGELLSVEVAAGVPDGTVVTLLISGSYGPRVFRSGVNAGRALFAIDSSNTRRSGVVSLTAAIGEARSRATLSILPGSAVEPVVPLVGARSIIADGAHWAMVIAVPTDEFGNPVADGTPVQFRALHPQGTASHETRPTAHLLAWQRLWSGTVAGRSLVAVQVGEAYGPQRELFQIAGWPVGFSLYSETGPFAADGRQLVAVRTSVIQDRYGNVMPDGTQVSFVVEAPDGKRIVPAFTIDGVAETVVEAPAEPGPLIVRGSLYGVSSGPLELAFGPAVAPFPVRARVSLQASTIYLEAGPLVGALGQHVPDGTEARFVVGAGDQASSAIGQSSGGLARVELRLPVLAAGEYAVEVFVGGQTVTGRFTIPAE